MKNQIDADARMKGRVGIALTEYLFRAPFSPAPPDYPAPRVPEYRNLGGAIWLAGMLNTLIRVADFVPIANMTGAVEFGRLWEKRGITYGVPSYWAFRMYSNADVANLLETKVEVARLQCQRRVAPHSRRCGRAVSRFSRGGESNWRQDHLFGVNRSLTADIASTIKLSGFSVHSATGTLLAADTSTWQR